MALRSCFSIISTYYIDMADDKKDQFHTNEHGVLLHNTIEKSGENIRTIFDYSGDIDSFIDWVKEKSIKVKRIEERYDDVENVYEIYSDKGTSVVGLTYYRSVMIIRSPKDYTMIDDYLGKDDVARISHGKEEFTIRDGWTKITAKCNTLDSAIYDKEAELLPGTDYEFYLDKKIIAKFTKGIINGEKIISLTSAREKTILRAVWDIKLTGMMGMFTGIIKKHIKSGTEQAMQSIKEEIEK